MKSTERPETIESGFGKLVEANVVDNLNFLFTKNINNLENPYGANVTKKIISILEKEYK